MYQYNKAAERIFDTKNGDIKRMENFKYGK